MMTPTPAPARAPSSKWQDFREEHLAFLDEPWKLLPIWAMGPWLLFYLWFEWYAWRANGVGLFIDAVNMVTHEAGHPLFGYLGETMHLWGGTILQLLIPAALCLTFVRMRDLMGTAFCGWLFFENFIGIGVYMSDARSQALPLVSAEGSGDGPHHPRLERHPLAARAARARHADRRGGEIPRLRWHACRSALVR